MACRTDARGGYRVTPAQREALHWLRNHGGEGAINGFGALVADGQRAPFNQNTWRALRELGWLEMYAHRRVRIVEKETV
jgi:hypothetical protein